MRTLISLLVVTTLTSGCVSINRLPLDGKLAPTLKDQVITHTVREKPSFVAMTPGSAALGILGAAAMISQGNSIIRENKVADPADSIAADVAKLLSEQHGTRFVTSPISVNSNNVAQIATAVSGKARFVVDVETLDWSFVYFPTDWSHYRVSYRARARVIDADSKTVIAEGACQRMPDQAANAPTYDELLAAEATLLKKELALAAEACVKTLRTEMLVL
ncbi:hypothetical protein [Chitinimonas lacunae]|uniref:Lipoprotein n=1 Tax=Chitinimonas lacunae TaxID=1963018 RepID=A0ABV8MVR0_9NEIS